MILVVIIEQIVASLPPSTRLEFFNEDFHLVLQQDFNNPDDTLVDCLINLKDCSLHRTYGQLA